MTSVIIAASLFIAPSTVRKHVEHRGPESLTVQNRSVRWTSTVSPSPFPMTSRTSAVRASL